jgi:hypothetical protein
MAGACSRGYSIWLVCNTIKRKAKVFAAARQYSFRYTMTYESKMLRKRPSIKRKELIRRPAPHLFSAGPPKQPYGGF